MTQSEVLRKLQAEGLPATREKIRYAVMLRKITTPPQDGAGNFQFGEKHVRELRAWLQTPRKRGRHPQG